MAESYDPKAILGAQLETLATDIAKDNHNLAYGFCRCWPYSSSWEKNYALLARLTSVTNTNWAFGQLFKIESRDSFAIFKVSMSGTTSAVNEKKIDVLYSFGLTKSQIEKLIVARYTYTGNTLNGAVVSIYTDVSLNLGSVYNRVSLRQLDNHSGGQYSYEDWQKATFYTHYLEGSASAASDEYLYASLSGNSFDMTYSSPVMVNVSAYTTYSSILDEFNAGKIPYYRYTSGNTAIDLTFAGTRAIPNVGMVLDFNAVQNNTIYYVGFAGSSSSFGTVRTFPLFSSDNVKTSSDTSSWSSDNTNVPTRAAVESKISSAMSGSLGGFLGSMSPNDISLYQISGHTFLKGDWFVVSESGTAYYYPNNDRSASSITLNLLEGDEYYWTTSGTLVKKPSTALQIYSISSLSDWNSLTSPGLYHISVSGATNAPSTGTFSCLVSNENDNIRQIAFKSNNIYYRGKGYNTSWTAWKNVNDVDHATSADTATSATNYISGSTTYNIANAINSKQGTLHFIASNAGTLENPVADRQYVDGLVGGGWVFATAGVWKKYTDGSSVLAQTGTYAYLDELVVKAAYARRIQVLSDSLPNATMSPGYTQEYEGARHQWTQHVRYALTLTNTTDVACNIYIICGGRFTTSNADASTLHNFAGNLYIDGRLYSTPTATVMIQTWGPGDVNKQSIGTIAAYSSRTWEIWWEDYVDPQNPSVYHIHSVYVNTCI